MISIDRALEIRGACAGGTVLAPTGAGVRAIEVAAGSVSLRDLTLRAPTYVDGIYVAGAASAHLEDVWIDGAISSGIFCAGRVTGARVVVEDLTPHPEWHIASALHAKDGGAIELSRFVARGRMRAAVEALLGGTIVLTDSAVHRVEPDLIEPWNVTVLVQPGSAVTLRRTVIELTSSTGIVAADSTVSLEDVVVRDTNTDALVAQEGGRIDGQRVILERNRGAAILAHLAGHVALTDAVVRETRTGEGGWDGYGAWARDAGSTVRLERARIEANMLGGVHASAGAELTVIDGAISSTRPRPGGDDGFGAWVVDASRLALERCELVGNRAAGIVVGGEHTVARADLRDVTVRGTTPARGPEGNGLFVGGLGLAVGERVVLEENVANGAKIWNGGTAILSDVVVRDTQENAFLMGGNGIWVTEGSRLELTRALLERNRAAGVGMDGARRSDPTVASSAVLRDVVITETDSDALLGMLGNAVRASNGASLVIERALLSDNREAAISVQNPGTSAVLSDVTIHRTRARACFGRQVDPCPAAVAGGCGLAVFNQGSAELSRFLVREGALCGVMVAEAGRLELHDGEVSANPIGANVQVSDYDLTLLTDRVRYVDNERNYDGARLPVPDATRPLAP